jgi:hypothetical protein
VTGAPPRSIAITVACALGGLSAIQALAFAYAPQSRTAAAQTHTPWFPTFQFATAFLALVFLIALWRFRRWGLWGFLAVIVSQSAALLSVGRWSPVVLVFPLLVVGSAVWSWDRLR